MNMKTIVYDKASWHIDAGEPTNSVLAHFKFIMNWCDQNKLLSDEGLEILEFGIDDSISLHSRLLNDRGNVFMTKYYDTFISAQNDRSSEMDEILKTI